MKIATLSLDDGGLMDVKVIEALRELKIAATFYLPTCILLESVYGVQNVNAIRDIYLGMEVGAHGTRHRRIPPERSPLWESEITAGVAELSAFFGRHIEVFAWPYGYVAMHAYPIVEAARIRWARSFRSAPELVAEPEDRWAMPISISLGQQDSFIQDVTGLIDRDLPIHLAAHPWMFYKRPRGLDMLMVAIVAMMTCGYEFVINSEFFDRKKPCQNS